MIAIQILGGIFALFLLYHTYHNYQRKIFGSRVAFLWALLWIVMLTVTFFPSAVNIFLEGLQINRALDLFTIASILILFGIIFQMYSTMRRLEQRMEKLVRNEALETIKKDSA